MVAARRRLVDSPRLEGEAGDMDPLPGGDLGWQPCSAEDIAAGSCKDDRPREDRRTPADSAGYKVSQRPFASSRVRKFQLKTSSHVQDMKRDRRAARSTGVDTVPGDSGRSREGDGRTFV